MSFFKLRVMRIDNHFLPGRLIVGFFDANESANTVTIEIDITIKMGAEALNSGTVGFGERGVSEESDMTETVLSR